MTPDLWYLFLSSVLLTVLWIPHIIGQVMTKGPLTAGEYRDLREQSDFPAWVRRANRAHINFVEQYGAFAGLVIVAHLTGAANEQLHLPPWRSFGQDRPFGRHAGRDPGAYAAHVDIHLRIPVVTGDRLADCILIKFRHS